MNILSNSIILKEFDYHDESNVYYGSSIVISTLLSEDCTYGIKVYKLRNTLEKKEVARISMLEPKYIDCDIPNSILSTGELFEFLRAIPGLRSMPNNIGALSYKYPYTVWDALINEANEQYENFGISKRIPINLPIPDYSKLPTID